MIRLPDKRAGILLILNGKPIVNGKPFIFGLLRLHCILTATLALSTPSRAEESPLSAAQVVEKNVVARGGAAAWREIHSISFAGHMSMGRTFPTPAGTGDDAASEPPAPRRGKMRMMITEVPAKKAEVVALPFRLHLKRPRKNRLELDFAGHTAIQVYDGSAGWKLRPFMGRSVEPFSPAEMKVAASQQEIDGLLIDAAAKGSSVQLEGMDRVNGVRAYRLKVALCNGGVRRVWVDASTFLDIKVDGVKEVGGRSLTMTTLLADYRRVDRVMIPFIMETRGKGQKEFEKIVIEKVAINSYLPDARFAKP
jgi:hypothetical protein